MCGVLLQCVIWVVVASDSLGASVDDPSRGNTSEDPLRLILADASPLPYNYYSLGPLQKSSPLPFMHNLMFGLRDIPARFSESPVMLTDGTQLINRLVNDPTCRGVIVSRELRETVTKSLVASGGELHPWAKMAGSVIMVVKRSNGHLVGYNTEVHAIRHALGDHIDRHGGKKVSSVVVVGTKGAARSAITAALNTRGIDSVSLIGMDEERVRSLVEYYGLAPYTEGSTYDVIIGSVAPEAQETVMKKYPRLFGSSKDGVPLVMDLAFTDKPTPIVKWATPLKDTVIWQKGDLRLFQVILSVVTHEIWTMSLIEDKEVQESPLTKAAVDLPFIHLKTQLFIATTP